MSINISVQVPDIIVEKLRGLGLNKLEIQEIYKKYTIQCTGSDLLDETISGNFAEFIEKNRGSLFEEFPSVYESGGFDSYE